MADSGDLFDRMVAAGHASFSLAAAADGLDVTGRETRLVNAAITAGVVGALAVLREDDPDPESNPDRR